MRINYRRAAHRYLNTSRKSALATSKPPEDISEQHASSISMPARASINPAGKPQRDGGGRRKTRERLLPAAHFACVATCDRHGMLMAIFRRRRAITFLGNASSRRAKCRECHRYSRRSPSTTLPHDIAAGREANTRICRRSLFALTGSIRRRRCIAIAGAPSFLITKRAPRPIPA